MKQATRHDGWTKARREAYLVGLATGEGGPARMLRLVKMSASSLTRLRKRDPVFADLEAAARALGQRNAAPTGGAGLTFDELEQLAAAVPAPSAR